jgi:3D (Asp-Asp-Asp) domain-containing protein
MKLNMTALAIALLISVNVQAQTLNVTATAYCFSTKNHTASGDHPSIKTIGISRDLKQRYKIKWGTKLHIKGFGVRIVEDLMNRRIKNSVDIWYPTKNQCRIFGKKKTTITVID